MSMTLNLTSERKNKELEFSKRKRAYKSLRSLRLLDSIGRFSLRTIDCNANRACNSLADRSFRRTVLW